MRPSRLLVVALLSSPLTACVLGEESAPGCRADHPDDCPQGWTCRAGVCLRPTTPLSPVDGGAGEDAPDDTGGQD